MTPLMSAAGRFWLSLALASMRVISSSTPTIARSCPSTKGRGAVAVASTPFASGVVAAPIPL
jgi:hypothetical protein